MKTDWSEEICSHEPQQFEQLNPTTYIQRRNVKKVPYTVGENESFEYVCESRFISSDLYEEFMKMLDSPAQQQVINNFHSVSEGQQISDEDMLIIMSAIADLYETVAVLSGITS